MKLLEDAASMISMNTHLKGVLDFIGVFDITFLFIVEIFRDVQNGSVSILSSIYCQKIALSSASIDLVDLFPNRWFINFIGAFLLVICFFDSNFFFGLTKN